MSEIGFDVGVAEPAEGETTLFAVAIELGGVVLRLALTVEGD
jgi:hypothetical protein